MICRRTDDVRFDFRAIASRVSMRVLDYRLSVGIGFLSFFVSCSALASTVYLKDGSRLQGEVKTMTGEQLRLDTDFAGTLKLDRSQITGLTTDEAVPLALDSDKTVTKSLDYDAQDDDQYAETPKADRSESKAKAAKKQIALGQVAQIRPQKIAENKRRAQVKKYTLPEYARASNLDHAAWSGKGRLGIDGSSGNSDNTNVTAALSALRNTGTTRLDFLASANRATSDGDKTEANYLGRATYEGDLSRRWYAYATQNLERDKFQNYELRSRTSFGPGYFVSRQRRLIFKLNGGLGYEYTTYYESGESESELIASAGWHYGQLFGKAVKLSHNFDIYPQLTDSPSDNFSLTSVFAASVPIANSSVWAISARLEHDYNNNPRNSDTDKLDTIYSLAIQRTF